MKEGVRKHERGSHPVATLQIIYLYLGTVMHTRSARVEISKIILIFLLSSLVNLV